MVQYHLVNSEENDKTAPLHLVRVTTAQTQEMDIAESSDLYELQTKAYVIPS